MCNVLKRPCLKSLSISDEILSKFGVCGTPEYQRVTLQGSRTMGPQWPDKRDKTRFGSMARLFFYQRVLADLMNLAGSADPKISAEPIWILSREISADPSRIS